MVDVDVVGSLVVGLLGRRVRYVTVPRVLGFTVDVNVDGVVSSAIPSSVMRMSAQARNCSCGPQPLRPVPSGHVPETISRFIQFYAQILSSNCWNMSKSLLYVIFSSTVHLQYNSVIINHM